MEKTFDFLDILFFSKNYSSETSQKPSFRKKKAVNFGE